MAITWKSVGKGLAKAAKVAAPLAGFAVAPWAGIALGAASGLGQGKKSLRKMATGAALGGLGGLAGKAANVKNLGVLGGAGKALGGLAKAGKFVGQTAVNTFKTPQGGVDLSKLTGLGLGLSAFKGSRDEAKQAKGFNTANALLRQQMMERLSKGPDYSGLMDRITARPTYNFD